MQIILALLLFVGIVIMTTLIFVGYFLYSNSKKTIEINNVITSKEHDLLELYYSLEQMMTELESFTQNAKNDIEIEKEKIKFWREEIQATHKITNEKVKENTDVVPKSTLNENYEVHKVNLMAKYEKCIDLKSSKVWALYRRGLTIADIAKEMKIGQGEVNLILNFKKTI